MNWDNILKLEFQDVKDRREKELKEFWNKNKATVYSQTKETRVAGWGTKNDHHLQLRTGPTIKAYFYGEDNQINFSVVAFMLPKATPLPRMTYWTPIPRNFVTSDSEELKHIPYLGDDVDDAFVKELIDSYNGYVPGTKTESLDDDMFVRLVRRLVFYQNIDTSMTESRSSQDVQDDMPGPIIFETISRNFKGNYTADK